MNPISEKLGLQPDILEGATIVKMFGTEYAIIENYKSLIEYTECLVKVQGKHMRVVIEGEKLGIASFQPDECRVCGKIYTYRDSKDAYCCSKKCRCKLNEYYTRKRNLKKA